MTRVAYTLEGAAKAASVHIRDIEVAVRSGELKARTVAGAPIIMRADVAAWVETHPEWVKPTV